MPSDKFAMSSSDISFSNQAYSFIRTLARMIEAGQLPGIPMGPVKPLILPRFAAEKESAHRHREYIAQEHEAMPLICQWRILLARSTRDRVLTRLKQARTKAIRMARYLILDSDFTTGWSA
jgi:hypothetical protein